jgi:hypothetical protein
MLLFERLEVALQALRGLVDVLLNTDMNRHCECPSVARKIWSDSKR